MKIQLKNVLTATCLGFLWLFGAQSVSALTLTEVVKRLPSDGTRDDQFGISVAVSGNTAVIGADGDDDNGSQSGSAYIFDLAGATGTVTEVAKLLLSDGASVDLFGGSVAVSGNTVVIGAYGDNDNGLQSGVAYAF